MPDPFDPWIRIRQAVALGAIFIVWVICMLFVGTEPLYVPHTNPWTAMRLEPK